MKNKSLTQKRLREVLSYDPCSGVFIWYDQYGKGKNQSSGSVAGHKNSKGYLCITVDGNIYKAHRLAWLYMTGEWPKEVIDHKDTVKDNNKFDNLREATLSENAQNQIKPSRNNKSGRLGVTWDKKQEKWAATICINGKNRRLGRFHDPDVAHAAYLAAKATHHPFANIGVSG